MSKKSCIFAHTLKLRLCSDKYLFRLKKTIQFLHLLFQVNGMDLFIGATAISNNMILVTDNEKHLKRLQNIKIENWIRKEEL